MTQLTNSPQGNEEPVHAEESRGTAARLTDDARASKKGNQKGLGSTKPRGDIASKLVVNAGMNQTLCPTPAMVDFTHNLSGNQVHLHAEVTRASEEHRTDYTRRVQYGNKLELASPKPRGDIANKLVANDGKNQTLSPSPAMADLTLNLQGNQVPLHAEVTRASEEHWTDYTRGNKCNGNKEGLASSKPCGDKIANKAMTNFGKNSTLSLSPAMADLTHKLQGNQVPLHAKETRASEENRAVYARGSKNENYQGFLLPKPRGNKIANKVTTNKKMDDRVKDGKQLNAVLARLEQKRARGKPLPKRGDVKKAIVEEGVKKVIDSGKAFCCVSGPFDVDTFVRDLPFPTRSEPTATLWAKVEV